MQASKDLGNGFRHHGVATDIAADGGLVVRSATGLAETVAVTALRTLSLLDA